METSGSKAGGQVAISTNFHSTFSTRSRVCCVGSNETHTAGQGGGDGTRGDGERMRGREERARDCRMEG